MVRVMFGNTCSASSTFYKALKCSMVTCSLKCSMVICTYSIHITMGHFSAKLERSNSSRHVDGDLQYLFKPFKSLKV